MFTDTNLVSLDLCASNGNLNQVKALATHMESPISCTPNKTIKSAYKFPLSLAAANGHLNIVNYLYSHIGHLCEGLGIEISNYFSFIHTPPEENFLLIACGLEKEASKSLLNWLQNNDRYQKINMGMTKEHILAALGHRSLDENSKDNLGLSPKDYFLLSGYRFAKENSSHINDSFTRVIQTGTLAGISLGMLLAYCRQWDMLKQLITQEPETPYNVNTIYKINPLEERTFASFLIVEHQFEILKQIRRSEPIDINQKISGILQNSVTHSIPITWVLVEQGQFKLLEDLIDPYLTYNAKKKPHTNVPPHCLNEIDIYSLPPENYVRSKFSLNYFTPLQILIKNKQIPLLIKLLDRSSSALNLINILYGIITIIKDPKDKRTINILDEMQRSVENFRKNLEKMDSRLNADFLIDFLTNALRIKNTDFITGLSILIAHFVDDFRYFSLLFEICKKNSIDTKRILSDLESITKTFPNLFWGITSEHVKAIKIAKGIEPYDSNFIRQLAKKDHSAKEDALGATPVDYLLSFYEGDNNLLDDLLTKIDILSVVRSGYYQHYPRLLLILEIGTKQTEEILLKWLAHHPDKMLDINMKTIPRPRIPDSAFPLVLAINRPLSDATVALVLAQNKSWDLLAFTVKQSPTLVVNLNAKAIIGKTNMTTPLTRKLIDNKQYELLEILLDRNSEQLVDLSPLYCIPQSPSTIQLLLNDKQYLLLEKLLNQQQKWYGFDLISHPERNPGVIYLENNPAEGVKYEVIGLDGQLKKNTIPWNELSPLDCTISSSDIKKSKIEILSKILEHSSKVGHTHSHPEIATTCDFTLDETALNFFSANQKITTLTELYRLTTSLILHVKIFQAIWNARPGKRADSHIEASKALAGIVENFGNNNMTAPINNQLITKFLISAIYAEKINLIKCIVDFIITMNRYSNYSLLHSISMLTESPAKKILLEQLLKKSALYPDFLFGETIHHLNAMLGKPYQSITGQMVDHHYNVLNIDTCATVSTITTENKVCFFPEDYVLNFRPEDEVPTNLLKNIDITRIMTSQCDLIRMSSSPMLNPLILLPIQSNRAYICYKDQLLFVNRITRECFQIKITPDKLIEFNKKMQPTDQVRILSADDLNLIKSITGHSAIEGTPLGYPRFMVMASHNRWKVLNAWIKLHPDKTLKLNTKSVNPRTYNPDVNFALILAKTKQWKLFNSIFDQSPTTWIDLNAKMSIPLTDTLAVYLIQDKQYKLFLNIFKQDPKQVLEPSSLLKIQTMLANDKDSNHNEIITTINHEMTAHHQQEQLDQSPTDTSSAENDKEEKLFRRRLLKTKLDEIDRKFNFTHQLSEVSPSGLKITFSGAQTNLKRFKHSIKPHMIPSIQSNPIREETSSTYSYVLSAKEIAFVSWFVNNKKLDDALNSDEKFNPFIKSKKSGPIPLTSKQQAEWKKALHMLFSCAQEIAIKWDDSNEYFRVELPSDDSITIRKYKDSHELLYHFPNAEGLFDYASSRLNTYEIEGAHIASSSRVTDGKNKIIIVTPFTEATSWVHDCLSGVNNLIEKSILFPLNIPNEPAEKHIPKKNDPAKPPELEKKSQPSTDDAAIAREMASKMLEETKKIFKKVISTSAFAGQNFDFLNVPQKKKRGKWEFTYTYEGTTHLQGIDSIKFLKGIKAALQKKDNFTHDWIRIYIIPTPIKQLVKIIVDTQTVPFEKLLLESTKLTKAKEYFSAILWVQPSEKKSTDDKTSAAENEAQHELPIKTDDKKNNLQISHKKQYSFKLSKLAPRNLKHHLTSINLIQPHMQDNARWVYFYAYLLHLQSILIILADDINNNNNSDIKELFMNLRHILRHAYHKLASENLGPMMQPLIDALSKAMDLNPTLKRSSIFVKDVLTIKLTDDFIIALKNFIAPYKYSLRNKTVGMSTLPEKENTVSALQTTLNNIKESPIEPTIKQTAILMIYSLMGEVYTGKKRQKYGEVYRALGHEKITEEDFVALTTKLYNEISGIDQVDKMVFNPRNA